MATIEIDARTDERSLDDPVLVEGLPGVGLVGKIATDHIIDELGMEQFGEVTGEGIAPVAVFTDGNATVESPVRLFVDEERDLLALRSDVPISSLDAEAFIGELTDWLADVGALPLYLSGLPTERDPEETPTVSGIGVGEGPDVLDEADVDPPDEDGMVTGPGGGLLSRARATGLDAVGLIVDTDPRFPDPQGAHALITRGIEPLADVDVGTDRLVERGEEIVEQREQLARRMQQADEHESSQAASLGMYQ